MQYVKKILSHPLISSTSIMLIASFVANVLGYLFNLAMGRLLTVADYGLLISLTSTFILFTIIQSSLIGIFSKYAAKFHAANNEEHYASLLYNGLRFVGTLSIVLLVVLLLSLPIMSWYLHISNFLLLLFIPILISASILYALPVGILQGKLMIASSAVLTILGPLLKIILSLTFIFLGFKLFGVLFGILISVLTPLVVAFIILFRKKEKKERALQMPFFDEFKEYGIKFFLASLGIAILTNVDVILARHYLGNFLAGEYAALSLMGKAIFYFTSPIYFIFFPLIAQKKERKEPLRNTLLFAVFIILLVSCGLAIFYFLFPNVVLRVFFPDKAYSILAPYLGFYALFIVFFSVATVFNNYFLSVGKANIYKITLTCGILYVTMVYFLHDNLSQFIFSLCTVSIVMLLSLLLYYVRYETG